MRLSIEHTTGFNYAGTVRSSYNEARLTPTTSSRQSVWSSRVTVEPTPWTYTYSDYWGTQVTAFELHDAHRTLTVSGFSVVETSSPEDDWSTTRSVRDTDADWDRLRSTGVMDRHHEVVINNDRTRPDEELAEISVRVAGEQPPRLAARDICAAIRDRIDYQPGSTQVRSTAAEVWQGGSGVCQDFSHLAIGALRSVGIPTRYVSGYLHPIGTQAETGSTVEGESHSWIEFWCGQWTAFDPTSLRIPGEDYVRIGHGRDYHDVAPLRGTYAGGRSDMFVTVSLTRLG